MALISGTMSVVTSGTPAAAFEGCPSADPEAINEFLAEMATSGLPADGADAAITQEFCSLTPVGDYNDIVPQPMSSPSNVDWYNMSMFYDNAVGYYVATSTWKWVNQGFIDDDIVVCVNNNVGGNDAVGIRFSGGGMQIIGRSATAWGNPAKDGYQNDFGFATMANSQVSDSGVGMVKQDTAVKLKSEPLGSCTDGQYDYNMWGGSATVTFRNLNGCRNVQMYPGYVHTWNSTSVTSIGAGPYQFSIGWSSAGESWVKEEAGPTANICD
ncbi:hypothetical protein [Phytohabitans aurantiacus]|uniref:Uncharacterized protein n=1 Tax=Phytohabitans aurantiacus TaxID=3016789 RepID=A0ABQ5R643_9ACTN|nr:hypothetical protein [Phytohabitans aurantiacus]GLI01347.1 hypothetical protein Pa4123_66230 [Phytohabitans aurantiacus]